RGTRARGRRAPPAARGPDPPPPRPAATAHLTLHTRHTSECTRIAPDCTTVPRARPCGPPLMLGAGGPAGDGTVPGRAGELGHFRPVGMHYVNLLHATALAGEGDLLAIRRPSREVLGGCVIGELRGAGPIRV